MKDLTSGLPADVTGGIPIQFQVGRRKKQRLCLPKVVKAFIVPTFFFFFYGYPTGEACGKG
jgi:hypothetical protein